MTLAYSVRHADCVQILSDAAHYLPDGTLTEITSKVRVSERVPLAVISAGSTDVGNLLNDAIITLTEFGSFDVAINMAFDIIRQLRGTVPEGMDFVLIIAGISESLGPCHFVAFSKAPPEAAHLPPFNLSLVNLPDFGNGVQLSADDLTGMGLTPELAQSEGSDLLRHYGIDIAECLRGKKMKNYMAPEKPALHGIGGFLELTTISTNSCVTERLRTWPEDRVGHKIKPVRKVSAAA